MFQEIPYTWCLHCFVYSSSLCWLNLQFKSCKQYVHFASWPAFFHVDNLKPHQLKIYSVICQIVIHLIILLFGVGLLLIFYYCVSVKTLVINNKKWFKLLYVERVIIKMRGVSWSQREKMQFGRLEEARKLSVCSLFISIFLYESASFFFPLPWLSLLIGEQNYIIAHSILPPWPSTKTDLYSTFQFHILVCIKSIWLIRRWVYPIQTWMPGPLWEFLEKKG